MRVNGEEKHLEQPLSLEAFLHQEGRHLQESLHRYDGPGHGEGRQCVA